MYYLGPKKTLRLVYGTFNLAIGLTFSILMGSLVRARINQHLESIVHIFRNLLFVEGLGKIVEQMFL